MEMIQRGEFSMGTNPVTVPVMPEDGTAILRDGLAAAASLPAGAGDRIALAFVQAVVAGDAPPLPEIRGERKAWTVPGGEFFAGGCIPTWRNHKFHVELFEAAGLVLENRKKLAEADRLLTFAAQPVPPDVEAADKAANAANDAGWEAYYAVYRKLPNSAKERSDFARSQQGKEAEANAMRAYEATAGEPVRAAMTHPQSAYHKRAARVTAHKLLMEVQVSTDYHAGGAVALATHYHLANHRTSDGRTTTLV